MWEFLLVCIQIDPFLVDSSGLLSPIQWFIYINILKNFMVVLLLLKNNKDIAEAPDNSRPVSSVLTAYIA